MKNLKSIINDNYIKYFKEKNILKNAYWEIKTQIVLKEKELKRELNDNEVESILESYVKKISKSIDEFNEKNIDNDIVKNLKNEVNELSQFISQTISWDELKSIVQEIIESWIRNVGEFMRKLNDFWKIDKKQAKEYFDQLTNN